VVKHSYREANKCADVLTSIGCTLDSTIVFYDSCPVECSHVMQDNIMGIATPRYINICIFSLLGFGHHSYKKKLC
jgi:hypothetical protein